MLRFFYIPVPNWKTKGEGIVTSAVLSKTKGLVKLIRGLSDTFSGFERIFVAQRGLSDTFSRFARIFVAHLDLSDTFSGFG